jgi:hypothetical protein
MPMDYDQCPEFAGPVSEPRPPATTDGLQRFPEAAGPMSELPGIDYGSPGFARIGRIDPPLSPEVRDRERAQAERQWAIRQAAERAAMAAGMNALQAGQAAGEMIDRAREAADRAVQRS